MPLALSDFMFVQESRRLGLIAFCDEHTRFGTGNRLSITCTEKGKPAERQGRKATGLRV